jgi:dienelactone hydrolase
MRKLACRFAMTAALAFCLELNAGEASSLPGTEPLVLEGDIASQLVTGVDTFLLEQLEKSIERRARLWKRDFSSAEKYTASIEPNRKRLATILGVRDARVAFDAPELIATPDQPALIGRGENYEIFAVRWPAFGDVTAEGVMIVPSGRKPVANVVCIPDADQSPEQLCGLVEGVAPESQVARRLAESGCRVLIPALIGRHLENRRVTMTDREFIYRPAFVLGRHIIGYEIQKVLAAVDFFSKDAGAKIGVLGYGEGGMLALYAAALDTRITACGVSGYFADRRNVWQEPIDRNVFGLLDEFGDAEAASLIAPRPLTIEACHAPEITLPPGKGGAPGRLVTPALDDVRSEVARTKKLTGDLNPARRLELATSGDGNGPFGSAPALTTFLDSLVAGSPLEKSGAAPKSLREKVDFAARTARQIHELDRHTQSLLTESPYVRQQFMKKLDTSSPEKFGATSQSYRETFYNDVIGKFDEPVLPFNARTRKAYDTEAYVGYEVTLDVFPHVFAYGVLLVPKNIKAGERRPIVVCQHGLEGRPADTILTEGKGFQYYHAFAAKLAERGFVTFAPQNLYIFGDRFRSLQRKANPLKKTLFSIITPQHQQIVDWLKTQPFVDSKRIAFYGLSYGGKTAMRVPALVTDYCLSICSGDFNEWVWKNASTRSPYSYVGTGEYEIFEWDLGSTFNYAEMAALIAPRPFMVERGHFDGVAPNETVSYEFGKVLHLYEGKLKLQNRCEIEFFDGPHTINGNGTFDFLYKHLNWPKP